MTPTLTPSRRAENVRLIEAFATASEHSPEGFRARVRYEKAACNDLPLYEAALAEALTLLDRVYQQAGNAAPAERRHVLTPGLRDDIRDCLKAAGHFGGATT